MAQLRNLSRHLHNAVRKLSGAVVTFHRGSSSVSVAAALGTSEMTVNESEGVTIVIQTSDFIVNRNELVLNSAEVLPRPGDRITMTVDGVPRNYEVINPAFGISDSSHSRIRIYTRLK